MKARKILSVILALAMIISVFSTLGLGAFALELSETVRFEGEGMTLVGTYEDKAFGTQTSYSPSGGQWLQYGVVASKTTYVPLFAVFEVEIETAGLYSLLYAGRHHESGRMIQFSFGKEAGISADKLTVDTSSDIIAGKVDATVFPGGNANQIEHTKASLTGEVGSAANTFSLDAGTYYFKMLITDMGSRPNHDECRLNIDYVELTLEGLPGEPGDYTAVQAAIDSIPETLEGIYTPASIAALEAAKEAVAYELDSTHQADIDKMASDIYQAINDLIKINQNPTIPSTEIFLGIDTSNSDKSSKGFGTQNYNGSDFSRFDGTAVGDYAIYSIDVALDGYYEIIIDYRAHESVGKAFIDINNARQTTHFVSEGAANTRKTVSIGKYNLKAGINDIKFTMFAPGSNGTNYRVNIFNFTIIPQLSEDQSAAKAVIDMIDALAIPNVDGIELAREAFDALTPEQQALVTNLDVLVALEAQIAPADYAEVYTALGFVPADLSIYTSVTQNALDEAVNSIDYTLLTYQQETVDGYITEIESAIAALEIDFVIQISSNAQSVSETKFDAVWNANVLLGNSMEQSAYDAFNDAGVNIKEYGIYYGTSATAVGKWQEFATDPTLTSSLRQSVFGIGDDIKMFASYGFRLRNCTKGATRAAMFYAVYEFNGTLYTVTSEIDEFVG